MDKTFLDKDLGAEGHFKIAIAGSKARLTVSYVGKQADGTLDLGLDIRAVLDLVKAAIPGTMDDVVIDAAEAMAGV